MSVPRWVTGRSLAVYYGLSNGGIAIGSWLWGPKAPNNPWNATTLEWTETTSPPPHGNFTKVPVVHHGPYEYSSPLVEEDWLAQTRYVEGAEKMAHLGH